MFTDLKSKTESTGNLTPKTLLPSPNPLSSPRRGNWVIWSWELSHPVSKGSDTQPKRWWQPGGLGSGSKLGHPLRWEMLGACQDTNPPPGGGGLNRMVGNQGSSARIPRPTSSSTSLLPVYRSRSRNPNYQRESRRLRNMSIHDITWKSWLLIGASYNLSGSHRKTGSL